MPPVSCRRCNGSGSFYTKSGKRLDCRSCNGRGINQDLWETSCRECYARIVYKKGHNEPTYCKSCRQREKTKTCAQWGCNNTVIYKLGWSNTPDYCGSCYSHHKKGHSSKSCVSCGNLLWVPFSKNYTMCRDCSERERAKKAAQWKTKSCSSCGTQIKYHVDWPRVPDLCEPCKEKAKAKWKTKPCRECGGEVRYNIDWDHSPNFCKSCKEKRKKNKKHQSPRTHLTVVSDGKNERILDATGKKLATMGQFSYSDKDGPNAEKQNAYARDGYWWLALEGKPHLTYVFREKPVQNGKFISLTENVEIKGPRWFYNLVVSSAVATLSIHHDG